MTRDEVAAAVIARVLKREGGILDVGDGKGLTRFGQTPTWLQEFGFEAPETPGQAAANYRRWLDYTRLIELCDVDDSLVDIAIDYAVHAGHPRAVKALQRAIGVAADGVVGPATIAALVTANRRGAAVAILADRNDWNGHLITAHPDWYAADAEGWAHRLSELIRGLA